MDNEVREFESLDWNLFLETVKSEITELSFTSWIEPLSFSKIQGSILVLHSPSSFIKNWVELNFLSVLVTCIKKQLLHINTVEIIVNSTSTKTSVEYNTQTEATTVITNPSNTFEIPLNPNYTFENFVVGKPNMFAYNAAKGIAENSSDLPAYNPLFIHGGVGLGKTHLMHSIAWKLKEKNPNKQFLYLTAEKFMNLYVIALRDRDILSFKEMFRSTDILMIDDFQFMSGKDQTQEEFFHTFNSLISQGKQIILSADKSPHLLDRIEERIRSRLQAGLSIDIHETNYELRLGILESKSILLKIKFPKDVMEFLAHSVTSNVRELEGCFNRLVSYHRIMQAEITLDLAMEQLKDIIKHNNKMIDVELIQKKVSEHYMVKFTELSSAKKDKQTVLARHVAAYICKQLTKLSLSEIGKRFGGRDHATIIYSISKIEKNIATDNLLENEIKVLIRAIQQN